MPLFFGGYVVIVFGSEIYKKLGADEESRYIATWGMAFLVNTFGVESLQVCALGRGVWLGHRVWGTVLGCVWGTVLGCVWGTVGRPRSWGMGRATWNRTRRHGKHVEYYDE